MRWYQPQDCVRAQYHVYLGKQEAGEHEKQERIHYFRHVHARLFRIAKQASWVPLMIDSPSVSHVARTIKGRHGDLEYN